jgi:hypothetical protein
MLTFEQLEQGLRNKTRFKGPNGLVTTEDLYDLSVQNLDKIAVALRKELRGSEDSFLEESKDQSLELRFNIVKHVLDTKLKLAEAAKEAKANRERRQVLLAALERKQASSIDAMSEDELKAELAKV